MSSDNLKRKKKKKKYSLKLMFPEKEFHKIMFSLKNRNYRVDAYGSWFMQTLKK